MRAVNRALTTACNGTGALWQPAQFHRGLPKINTPPPYVLYGRTDSKRGGRNSFTEEHRLLEYTFVAACFDPEQSEDWSEAIEALLLERTIPVAGWEMVEPMLWNGYVQFPAQLLKNGQLLHTEGVRMVVNIQRPRLRP